MDTSITQNFLADQKLVSNLLAKSSISSQDVVIDIGAGKGIITKELAKMAKKVIAYELDPSLYQGLRNNLSSIPNVEIVHKDFLEVPLPQYNYKVFSNIPFNISTQILNKLLNAKKTPNDSYLIVQKEFAYKYVGKSVVGKEYLAALILKPRFDFNVIYNFRRNDFTPKPSVDIVLLNILKREDILVSEQDMKLYKDFITFAFSQWKPTVGKSLEKIFSKKQLKRLSIENRFPITAKPSTLSFEQWLSIFAFFKTIDKRKIKIVAYSYSQKVKQQQNIKKIHRTRNSNNWNKLSKI